MKEFKQYRWLLLSSVVLFTIALIPWLLNEVNDHFLLNVYCKIKEDCYSSNLPSTQQKLNDTIADLIILSIYVLASSISFILLIRYRALIKKYLPGNKQVYYYLIVFNLILTSFYSIFILKNFPNSADEYSYLFQAATYADGRLYNPAPPLPGCFQFTHSIISDGKWVGRFPPGWPLLIAGFLKLTGLTSLLNPILSTLVLIIIYKFAEELFKSRIALLTLLTLVVSPYFIFHGASYFSHMSELLFILLFYYSGYYFTKNGKYLYAILAGFSIGIAFLIRTYTSVLMSVPFIIYYLNPKLFSLKRIYNGIWFIIGFMPCILFSFFYNYRITGDPFLFVTQWIDHSEQLGFVKGHTVLLGIIDMIRRIILFLLWASPALILLIPGCLKLSGKIVTGWTPLFILSFIILVSGYIFWHSYGGNQYGPRFYFEAYPFLVIGISSIVFSDQYQNVLTEKMKTIFFVGIIFTIISLPRITYLEHRAVGERMDVFKQTERMELHNSIVIITNGTGIIKPMPISDLLHNDPALENEVLFISNPDGNDFSQIKSVFPNRDLYIYRREKGAVEGEIESLSSIDILTD